MQNEETTQDSGFLSRRTDYVCEIEARKKWREDAGCDASCRVFSEEEGRQRQQRAG